MHHLHEKIGIPKIVTKEVDGNTTVFIVEPLPVGYGMTLGNALRRVLLSSLPGAAVTGIKMKGVTHEYTTLAGVKDSVLDMILNFKGLRFKKHTNEPSWLKLKLKKAGEVLAKEIELPSDVEILNPDTYITTLDNNSTELDLEIRVEKGVGYVSTNELKKKEVDSSVILVDASFSPVMNVRYEVLPARVGQMTNLDKLEIEIKTDVSLSPAEALRFAADVLKSYFSLFSTTGELVEPDFISDPNQIKQRQDEEEAKSSQKDSYTPIEILNLSPRTLNALINGGIGSIEQLVKCTESKLSNLRGFGKKAMMEIKAALRDKGLIMLKEEER
ncbi:DNA-directed RNA polymerase subunit alpha [Candidatus Peregrinibacteria bacterium CG08_land_8_20_14_0_20_41_10]|nr:MAG: DNA-directed RNA polymerase subunit alpha [Candidatus Peregrinibacteria bacterium CG1_02_41_10]PIS32222.1 MAG: DNA-directed RNA polymerase subunit alpha [Candidatus Peregrinibacteria bacterium CG08_land_8_20_14_0_20_41_10]